MNRELLRLRVQLGKDRTVVKNEIGEIERFPDYKKLCSFAGLVPRVHQAANTRWEGH
ncbi:MAG: transposase [Halobacteriota archaeon]